MNEPQNTKKPLLVRFALLGIRSPDVAWICVWFSVALAVFSAGLAFWRGPKFFFPGFGYWLALGLLLAALGYWLAIRWMDKNNAWPKPPAKS